MLKRCVVEKAPSIDLLLGRVIRRGGISPYTKVYRQRFRVADLSLERYELYVFEGPMPDGGEVDFEASGQPVAVGSALPLRYTPSLPESGQTTLLKAVTRYRNRYNLLSFNQHPTCIEITPSGEEELGPLSCPEILQVIDGESGQIIVFARYPVGIDRHPADTWELYVDELDSLVVTFETLAASEAFGAPGADWRCRLVVEGLTPGVEYSVGVAVRRTEDDDCAYSIVWEHTCALAYDMDEGEAELFGGQEHEIGGGDVGEVPTYYMAARRWRGNGPYSVLGSCGSGRNVRRGGRP